MVAVPLLLFMSETPLGKPPPSVIDMDALVGNPVVLTMNDCPALPGANVVLFALVIAGGALTVIMNICGALVSTPPLAVPPLSWMFSVMVDVPPVELACGVYVS